MKTLKQIADMLSIDKQKIYRYIKRNHISEALQKNGVMYYDETVETEIIRNFSQENHISEAHQKHISEAVNDTVIEVVINMLKNELNVKNSQIENLQAQIIDLQSELAKEREQNREQTEKLFALAENTQKLHAGTIQQQLTISEIPIKESKPYSFEDNAIVSSRNWFYKLFKRN